MNMKKAIIILLTAAVVAGLRLVPAGFPVSQALAAVATPGNMAREESVSGGQEENNKSDDPKPTPVHHVTATLKADKDTIQEDENTHAELRFSGLDSPENTITELTWGLTPGEHVISVVPTGNKFRCFIAAENIGTATLIAKWQYRDPLIKGDTEASIRISVVPRQTDSSGSRGGSDGSGGSSSSKSSKQAKAPAPLAPVTPIATDLSGISHFGNAVIARPPADYPEQARASLITSGTWSRTSTGFWQLSAGGGILRNCWALVSDALSQDPAGNASWFYFDENGHMAVGWKWIAASDGLRCYYFNQEDGKLYGALVMNGTTPDGYMVDETGAWMENGTVKTIPVS